MSKTATTFTLVTLAAVLLSTVAIGSTSASSKVFSNSGNNIITKQNCIADGSCNLSSSNVINREPASTAPSPSPAPCPGGIPTTILLLALAPPLLSGSLECESDSTGVAGATITFTGTGFVHPNLVATTDSGGEYFVDDFGPPTTPGTYTVQAHFAGLPGISPSDSGVLTFTVK